jgi:hypothetical protein
MQAFGDRFQAESRCSILVLRLQVPTLRVTQISRSVVCTLRYVAGSNAGDIYHTVCRYGYGLWIWKVMENGRALFGGVVKKINQV